jgi:hypothetical protein
LALKDKDLEIERERTKQVNSQSRFPLIGKRNQQYSSSASSASSDSNRRPNISASSSDSKKMPNISASSDSSRNPKISNLMPFPARQNRIRAYARLRGGRWLNFTVPDGDLHGVKYRRKLNSLLQQTDFVLKFSESEVKLRHFSRNVDICELDTFSMSWNWKNEYFSLKDAILQANSVAHASEQAMSNNIVADYQRRRQPSMLSSRPSSNDSSTASSSHAFCTALAK